jgi:hypothetical protein
MKFKVPYYHDPEGVFLNSDSSLNFELFEKLPIDSPVVINFSWNPFNVKEINDLLKSQGIRTDNIIFLTSNYDKDSKDNNIIFYPSWLLSTRLMKKLPIDIKRNNKVSCLNRIAKCHRFYLYYLLKEKKYFNDLVYTLQGMCSYDNNITWDNGSIVGLDHLPIKIKAELTKLDLNVTTKQVLDPNRAANDHSNNHIAYTDSYMNIVTESSYSLTTPFFSEKTIKPLVSGQLFLMAGDQHSVTSLNALGFETFDNSFNNHNYDNFFTYKQRIDSMVDLLDSVYENVESIYFDNIHAIKHNQEYALSDTFRNKFLKPLLDLDVVDTLNLIPT